jgi:aarF domain-containing kinase
MLKKNLGENWRSLFKNFEETPFASASIGQVHRATLPNGLPVAVKVQYNGVKQSIESDIQNLGLLMRIPGLFPKGIFIERILKNTRS